MSIGNSNCYDEEELYNLNTKEFVCSNHINENFIKAHIKKNGSRGRCNYCKKIINVVELSKVLELIIVGINYLFEDPINSRYYNKEGEHGFDGDTFEFDEMWSRLGLNIDNDKLHEDIYNHLYNISVYCEKDEFGSEEDFLNDVWYNFKNVVKHKARFVFYFKKTFANYSFVDPVFILEHVQKSIIKLKLIVDLKENTKLYRCRQHSQIDDIKIAENIAAPPYEYSKANGRMNPAGISMFYCCEFKALSIKEVVDVYNKKKRYYSTAIFRNKKNLRLVNLSKLPKIDSIYDEEKNVNIDTILFLEGFIKDISKSIDDEDSIIEYIPTQIVTEYLKFNPKLNIDGIIYPSSKCQNNNIVLFFDHEKSLKELDFEITSIETKKIF